MTINFHDEVRIRFLREGQERTVRKDHNTMSTDFFDVVATALAQGLQSAVLYGYTTSSQVPTQTYIVFSSGGTVEHVAPVQVQSASGNSVVLNFYDSSTSTYSFDQVAIWAGTTDQVLYYPVAYATLPQQEKKSSAGFLEVTWTITWVPSFVFLNIPSQLLNNAPTPLYLPTSSCSQPFVSAIIMALMGLPANTGACAYYVLAQNFQNFGVNGVSYIAFYDSSYNLITYVKGDQGVVTFNTQPAYILVVENAGGAELPLLGGQITLPVNSDNAYNVEVSFSLNQGVTTNTTGISNASSSSTSTSTSSSSSSSRSSTGSTGSSSSQQCIPIRTSTGLLFACNF
jgi:hypothetical protein